MSPSKNRSEGVRHPDLPEDYRVVVKIGDDNDFQKPPMGDWWGFVAHKSGSADEDDRGCGYGTSAEGAANAAVRDFLEKRNKKPKRDRTKSKRKAMEQEALEELKQKWGS